MAQFGKGGGLEAPSQIPRKTSRARFLKESNPEVYWDTSMGPIPCFVQKLGYTSHAPRKKPRLSKGQRVAVFSFFLFFVWNVSALVRWDCIWHCMQPWKACVQGKRHDHDNVHHTVITQTCSYVGIVLLAGVWGNVLPKNIRINHHIYPELLCDFPPDSFELTKASISLYDGVSSHTAKSVALWLEDCMVPFVKDQPDKSPDLNPIENL